MTTIPRAEHPNPQFERATWMNLNGPWQFELDQGCSGEARGLHNVGIALHDTITVPFCPESQLSGIGCKDFMNGVWYKRTVNIPVVSGHVFLRFGAVDYQCKAFVNGKPVGEHKGGYVSFGFDITEAVLEGENEIAVFAADDTRNRLIPSGKQCRFYDSKGCLYTRTTGIWQTVWLEFVPESYIERVKYYPNIEDGSVVVEAKLHGQGSFTMEAFYEGSLMGGYHVNDAAGTITFTLPLKEKYLWEPGAGRLYDVKLTFGEDTVSSYFGLRQVRLDGYKFLINGKSVFQRLILDQGFYPDGIYTAPTEQALVRDIELSLALGFNGARLHEKVFEQRFLYHADRMGYLVWGEYPNWGLDASYADSIYGILPEWIEAVERDFNHPSIIGWCPYNETWDKEGRKQYDDAIALVYKTTKAMDTTRPCIDTSGNFHVVTDIYDVHDYDQNPETFKANYDRLMTEGVVYEVFDPPTSQGGRYEFRQRYPGKLPVFVSEYGGIRWAEGEKDENRVGSWGYGKDVASIEDFYARYKGLTDALLDNHCMFGLCYTQLTDVEQEQNGLYTYDRRPKFDEKRLYAIMSRKAAIED